MKETNTLVIEFSTMSDEAAASVNQLLNEISQCFESAHSVQIQRYYDRLAQQEYELELELKAQSEQQELSDDIPF